MNLVATLLPTILLSSYVCNAYKVLIVFPLEFGKSHAILGEAQVRRLLEAGHEVSPIFKVFIYSVSSLQMTLSVINIAK